MTSGVLRCDGEVAVSMDGAPLCMGTWTLVPVPAPFEVDQIDPLYASQMIGFGFGLVASLWFVGWCCRAVLSMLKRG